MQRLKAVSGASLRAMCFANCELPSLRALHVASSEASTHAATSTPAFVFDIDGVLTRGLRVLPEAIAAMQKLYHPDKKTPRFPVAFLTNGGGMMESTKAAQLSDWLGISVAPEQVVLSHTPFRSLAPTYANDPVLILGRGDISSVAQEYGFKNFVTTLEIANALPTSVPFCHPKQPTGSALPSPNEPSSSSRLTRTLPSLDIGVLENPFKAVFVFTDPGDWYRDLQIFTDVLVGRGVLARRMEDVPPETPLVDVFFSNPDLLWANEHPTPRFGQGAFYACAETLYQRVTGSTMTARTFGKPNPEPYRLIEECLTEQARALGMSVPSSSDHLNSNGEPLPPFSAIFAVGDNPAADVRGARAAGWVSVLVRTGVFKHGENCTVDPAHIVVEDVAAAVDAALHYQRSQLWHSMR